MDEKDIIKKINQDYLTIINSKEYKLGNIITNICNGIKAADIRQVSKNLKLLLQGVRLQKYSMKSQVAGSKQVNNHDCPNGKTAVYTALFGGYDQIYEPVIKDENCDYFIFTDQNISDISIWKKLELSDSEQSILEHLTNTEKNRYFKMLGYKKFNDYEYSIYLDANLEIYGVLANLTVYADNPFGLALYSHPARDCIYNEAKACVILGKATKKDVETQMKIYQDFGMPTHYGMCECNVIVRKIANKKCFFLMKEWWTEFEQNSVKRDQLIFPYILWKNQIKINEIGCLGKDIDHDGLFRRKLHAERN